MARDADAQIDLTLGFVNRVPDDVAEGAGQANGLWSGPLGVFCAGLASEAAQPSASGPAPLSVVGVPDELLVQRAFPGAHSVDARTRTTQLVQQNYAGSGLYQQNAWPTQIISTAQHDAHTVEAPAALPAHVCRYNGAQYAIGEDGVSVCLFSYDLDGHPLAPPYSLGYSADNLNALNVSSTGRTIFACIGLIEGPGGAFVVHQDITHPAGVASRDVAKVDRYVLSGRTMTRTVIGTLAAPTGATAPPTNVGASAFICACTIMSGFLYVVWRKSAFSGVYIVVRYNTTTGAYQNQSADFTFTATHLAPFCEIKECDGDLIAHLGDKIVVLNPTTLAATDNFPITTAYDPEANGSTPEVFLGFGAFKTFSNRRTYVAGLQSTAPSGKKYMVLHLIERATLKHRRFKMPGCVLASPLVQLEDPSTTFDALVFAIARDGLDPASELMVLNQTGGFDTIGLGVLARAGVDQSTTIRGDLVISNGSASWVMRRKLWTDANPQAGSKLVVVELQDTGRGSFPPRSIQAAKKHYIAGGVHRIWDGHELLEPSIPWMPQIEEVNPGSNANYVMFRYRDAAGDDHRSMIAGPFTSDAWKVFNPPTSNTFGNSRPFNVLWWTVNSFGAGAGDYYGPAYPIEDSRFIRPTNFTALAITATNAGIPYTTNDGTGEVLAWAPPALWDIASVGTRLIGLKAEDSSNTYYYTKPKRAGIEYEWAAEMNGSLPAGAGKGVAVADYLGQVLIATESGCYVLSGEGYSQTLGDQDFAPPRLLFRERVAREDRGAVVAFQNGVFLKTRRGYVVLTAGEQVKRLQQVKPLDGPNLAVVVPDRSEIWVTNGTIAYVYNYELDKWSQSGPTNAKLAGLADNRLVFQSTSGSGDLVYTGPDTDPGHQLVYASKWVSPAGLQGELNVSAVVFTFRLSDYTQTDGGATFYVFADQDNVNPIAVENIERSKFQGTGSLCQVRMRAGRKCHSIRVAISWGGTSDLHPISARIIEQSDGKATIARSGPAR